MATLQNSYLQSRTISPPQEHVCIFLKQVKSPDLKNDAVLPYIKGLTENLQQTLRHHETHKNTTATISIPKIPRSCQTTNWSHTRDTMQRMFLDICRRNWTLISN